MFMNLSEKFPKSKYRTKLYLYFTMVMVFFIMIFSSIVYFNISKSIMKNEFESSQKVLKQMKFNIENMDYMIKNLSISAYYRDDVTNLMNYTDVETFEQMKIINELNSSIVSINPYIHSVYIYNNKKKVFYSTFRDFKYEDKDLINYIRTHPVIPVLKPMLRETVTYESDIYSKKSNVLSYFMYELKDKDNNLEGALIVNIKLDWIIDNIKAITQTSGDNKDEFFILNEQGEFVETYSNLGVQKNAFEQSVKDIFIKKGKMIEPGYVSRRINGKDYIVSFIPLENTNWVLFKTQPYATVFEYITRLRITIIIITIIIIILIVIAAYTLSLGLYKPINNLLKQMGFNKNDFQRDEFSFIEETYKNYNEKLHRFNVEKSDNSVIIKHYFLKKLLYQNTSISKDEFEKNRLQHNISLTSDMDFYAVLFIIDNFSEFDKMDTELKELLKFAFCNIAQEIISRSYNNELVEIKNNQIVSIVNVGRNSRDNENVLKQMISEIQNAMQEYYQVTLSAAISTRVDSIEGLADAFRQTEYSSLYRFVFGNKAVITPEMISVNKSNEKTNYSYDLQERLLSDLKCGDIKAVEKSLSTLIAEVRQLEYNSIMLSLAYLVNSIKSLLFELNQTRKEPININEQLSNDLFELETLEQFCDALLEVLRKVVAQDKPTEVNKDVQIAERIRDYILENYMDYNLGAADISSAMKISQSRTSKIFKENFNMSIPEYINNVRLTKAVEWMKNSNLSIGEIILKVGIENESYFYKIFKAKYGKTPRSY